MDDCQVAFGHASGVHRDHRIRSQAAFRHFSGIFQAFIRHPSGIHQAALRHLSGSTQASIRQHSGIYQAAALRHSSGIHQASVRHPSGIHQTSIPDHRPLTQGVLHSRQFSTSASLQSPDTSECGTHRHHAPRRGLHGVTECISYNPGHGLVYKQGGLPNVMVANTYPRAGNARP